MPYEVTPEVALEYEEVQKRLDRSINSLKRYTKLFLASIIKTKLPYSILYMAKVNFIFSSIFPLVVGEIIGLNPGLTPRHN